MRRILASPVQRHGLRPCDRPEIRNQRSGQTRRTRPRTPFGYEAGIGKFRAVSQAPTQPLDEGDKTNPNWREESGVSRND